MLSLRSKKRKVPKEYLAPRPMAGSAPPRPRWSAWIPPHWVALLASAVVATSSVLLPIDEWLWSKSLRWVANDAPPESVALVTFSVSETRTQQCGRRAVEILTAARVQTVLVLEPFHQFCATVLDPEVSDSELAPPVGLLQTAAIRKDPAGNVLGFEASKLSALGHSLGLASSRWVVARRAESIPTVDFSLLAQGALGSDILARKHVVLTLAQELTGSQPAAVAGALAGAVEGELRDVTPVWLRVLVSLLTCWAMVAAARFARLGVRSRTVLLFGCGLMLALWLAGILGVSSLFPLATGLSALGSCYGLLLLPPFIGQWRARGQATRILNRAALRTEAPHAMADVEFWGRLAQRAAQAHPADDVLIAELPAFSWRLRVWPNAELDESIIREQRRDIRRTPFANSDGVCVASITNNFLVMKGVPAVLVPLMVNEDVEGYLILIGNPAARHFAQEPEAAEKLAADLARVVRARRLARVQAEGWPGQSVGPNQGAEQGSLGLKRARAAVEELSLLNHVVQHAPVGLLYADSFGDVRIVSRATLQWLSRYQVAAPRVGSDGSVSPGVLPLPKLIAEFARATPCNLPQLSDIDETGFELQLIPPPGSEGARALKINVIRLADGVDETRGFVAALTEVPDHHGSNIPRISGLPKRGDPLVVASLAKIAAAAVQSAALRTSGQVKLQTPRDAANVIVHRAELRNALEALLIEAVEQGGKGSAPVLVLADAEGAFELKIVDLRLGAPPGALRRTLLAPSEPPPGLVAFAGFVQAVENSHGSVRVDTQEGWGLTLTARLLKARPRMEVLELTEIPRLAPVKGIQRLD